MCWGKTCTWWQMVLLNLQRNKILMIINKNCIHLNMYVYLNIISESWLCNFQWLTEMLRFSLWIKIVMLIYFYWVIIALDNLVSAPVAIRILYLLYSSTGKSQQGIWLNRLVMCSSIFIFLSHSSWLFQHAFGLLLFAWFFPLHYLMNVIFSSWTQELLNELHVMLNHQQYQILGQRSHHNVSKFCVF